jgi:hypothetical protein
MLIETTRFEHPSFFNLRPRRIRLTKGYAKSLRLKGNLEKDFAVAVYFSMAPFPPWFLSRGWQKILYRFLNLVT